MNPSGIPGGTPGGILAQVADLVRPFWPVMAICALCGTIAGLSVTALLAMVNRGLHSGADPTGILGWLALFCVLILAGSITSDIGTNWVGQRIIASLRKSLAAKIMAAPIEQLERYRAHRLIPVLTGDIDTISDFAFLFASFAVSLTVTIGCLAYLAYLSPAMFLVMIGAILVGGAIQGWARARGVRGFHSARDAEDDLQKHYRAISEGAKELRINRPRRLAMHGARIRATVDRIGAIQTRSINLFVIARACGAALIFVVVGVTLALRSFIWPDTDPAVVSGFVLILLYMKGPVDQVIGAVPAFGRVQVAFRRIAELSERFSSPEPDLLAERPTPPRAPVRLELEGVRYTFPKSGEESPFSLGPVSLAIEPGEILFIVGENGCGKTTLIKLLLGLYEPAEGRILVDGRPVGAEDRDDYRQLFTTVFSDYFLFEDMLSGAADMPEQARRYLDRLEVGHKVSVKDGVFSTTDLSTGQRKRLALMAAWLEGRPVLVFDEWAADQDPSFRRIFYDELLPDLKRLGKTIVVISHDDRYFGAADHLVRLEAGKMAEEERRGTAGEAAPPHARTERPATAPSAIALSNPLPDR